MFATMRGAWSIHGARWGVDAYDPEFLGFGEILEMATIESASVLHLDDIAGSIEPGKAADLVILDGTAPHLMAGQHLPSELVRYASRGEILQTIVAGRVLYDRGAFPTIDLDRLRAEAASGAAIVRETLAGRRFKPLPSF
jgi:5-methylthioadenosine/S-adenosylhomocysteine deaminase